MFLITRLPTRSTSSSILFAKGHALVQDVSRLPAPRCERSILDTQSPTYNSRSLQLRQTNLQATYHFVDSHLPPVSLIHKPNAHSPPVSDVSPLSSMAESKGTGKAQVMPPTPLVDTGLPSDERRAQELDQYYTPSKKSALRLTDRDSALPAHMQLICWRLGMRRALVSLIDRDTQYYVAESTRTMDLHNPDYYEDENDGPLSLVGLIRLRC